MEVLSYPIYVYSMIYYYPTLYRPVRPPSLSSPLSDPTMPTVGLCLLISLEIYKTEVKLEVKITQMANFILFWFILHFLRIPPALVLPRLIIDVLINKAIF